MVWIKMMKNQRLIYNDDDDDDDGDDYVRRKMGRMVHLLRDDALHNVST